MRFAACLLLQGDLKPGNVLIKLMHGAPYGRMAKVSDFGLSRALQAGQSHRSTRTFGTLNHTPPELLRLGRLSPAGGRDRATTGLAFELRQESFQPFGLPAAHLGLCAWRAGMHGRYQACKCNLIVAAQQC